MDINTSFYCCHHKTFFFCLLAAPPTTHHRHCWLFFHSVSISFHQMVIGVMLYAISLLEEIDSRHQPSPLLLLLLMLDARFDGYFWEQYLPEKENFSRYFFSLNSLRRSGIYNEDEISFFFSMLTYPLFYCCCCLFSTLPLKVWFKDLRSKDLFTVLIN